MNRLFIKGKYNKQIFGNNNIITDNYILELVRSFDDEKLIIDRLFEYKDDLIKKREKEMDWVFFWSIPFVFSLSFFIAAMFEKVLLFTALFYVTLFLSVFLIAKHIRKIININIPLKSVNELIIEIYKLIIIKQIKEKGE